ncbi:hypothetical protein M408DRAFT_22383 [Serendipita vermifera MAFF 305830]|uniref:Uncharacterized protein n=1 Tax=Serendipita vermifera MAFF 305830 TaxID=933852 RepID=A0A0C3BCQ9_SERVB|nr:hypothetical protein M408DRAFT_22383 [Serendipita vermifera MAFF 305830]
MSLPTNTPLTKKSRAASRPKQSPATRKRPRPRKDPAKVSRRHPYFDIRFQIDTKETFRVRPATRMIFDNPAFPWEDFAVPDPLPDYLREIKCNPSNTVYFYFYKHALLLIKANRTLKRRISPRDVWQHLPERIRAQWNVEIVAYNKLCRPSSPLVSSHNNELLPITCYTVHPTTRYDVDLPGCPDIPRSTQCSTSLNDQNPGLQLDEISARPKHTQYGTHQPISPHIPMSAPYQAISGPQFPVPLATPSSWETPGTLYSENTFLSPTTTLCEGNSEDPLLTPILAHPQGEMQNGCDYSYFLSKKVVSATFNPPSTDSELVNVSPAEDSALRQHSDRDSLLNSHLEPVDGPESQPFLRISNGVDEMPTITAHVDIYTPSATNTNSESTQASRQSQNEGSVIHRDGAEHQIISYNIVDEATSHGVANTSSLEHSTALVDFAATPGEDDVLLASVINQATSMDTGQQYEIVDRTQLHQEQATSIHDKENGSYSGVIPEICDKFIINDDFPFIYDEYFDYQVENGWTGSQPVIPSGDLQSSNVEETLAPEEHFAQIMGISIQPEDGFLRLLGLEVDKEATPDGQRAFTAPGLPPG